MTKAVVRIGGKQYIVSESETLMVDRLGDEIKTLEPEVLMTFDGTTTHVGTPLVKNAKVAAKVVQTEVKGDKLRIIRYKAKKRVHKETGHRQKYSQIQITSIR